MSGQTSVKATASKRGSGGFVTVGVVLTVVSSMMATLFGAGAASRVLNIFDGNVWLWSASKGEVSRVNSASGRVDIRQPLTDARNHRVQVIQTDKNLILRDLTTGKITSLDLTTLGVAGTVATEPGDGISVALYKDSAFIIDSKRGAIRQVDPTKLSPVGKPLSFASSLQGGSFDDEGRLWVAIPSEGTVARVTATKNGPSQPKTFPVTDVDHQMKLTVLDRGAAVVDQSKGALFTIRNEEVKSVNAPDLAPTADVPNRSLGSVVAVTLRDEKRVYLERSGKLSFFDVGVKGSRIGPAVAFNGRVYLNDDDAGSVLVYDYDGKQLQKIDLPDANGPLQLEVREEHLFINAPNSASARVVDGHHKIMPIDKYPKDVLGSEAPIKKPPVVPNPNKGPQKPQQNPNGNQTPVKQSPPGSPGKVTATAGNKSARIVWAGALPNGAAISSYVIEGGGKSTTVNGRSRSAVVNDLDNGTEYSFSVHAVNVKGPGPKSQSNSVRPTADVPDPPERVQAAADKLGGVAVTWPAADDQGTSIAGYTVTATGAGVATPFPATAGTQLAVPPGQLDLGTEYTFTVVTNSDNGAVSAPSKASNAVKPYTKPGAPEGLAAAASGQRGEVNVTWTGAEDHGSPITGWVVRAGGQTQNLPATAKQASFTGLQDGTRIPVDAYAVNAAGEGDLASTDATTPGVPTVQITSSSSTQDAITVNFTANANGSKLQSCTLTLGGKTANGCDGSLRITGLNAGQAYPFNVTATNGVGKSQPARGNETTKHADRGRHGALHQQRPTGDPNYCSDGVRVFSGPSQQNYSDVGAALNGQRYTGTCKAVGNQSITAYVYNDRKTSSWWIKIGNGRFLPYVWINLDDGDAALNRLATC